MRKIFIWLVFALLATYVSNQAEAKTLWNGFDFDVYSDAYDDNLPIAECVVTTTVYDVSFKFGETTKGSVTSSPKKGFL